MTTERALAELINQLDITKKAREEIDSVVGRSRLVEESDIKTFPISKLQSKKHFGFTPYWPNGHGSPIQCISAFCDIVPYHQSIKLLDQNPLTQK